MYTITSCNYQINSDSLRAEILEWASVAERHCTVITDGVRTVIAVQQWWDNQDPPVLYKDYTQDFLAEFAAEVSLIQE